MIFLVFILAVTSSVSAGIIKQDSDEGLNHQDHLTETVDHHEDDRPTSYQSIHIKHYHPVPVYIKKEHKQFLDHPVSSGDSSSQLEVHHGGKHDHGYAFGDSKQELNGYGGYGDNSENSDEGSDGQSHEDSGLGAYGGHYYGGGEDSGHYGGQYGGEEGGEDGGHYGGQYGGHYQGDESSEESNDGNYGGYSFGGSKGSEGHDGHY